MREFLKRNSVFIGLSLLLIVTLGLAVALIPRGELHLLLCDRHTPTRDLFYHYYTHVAEYAPYIICLLILLFSKAGYAALAASCIACSELTTQIVKHLVCAPRPLTWFAENMPDVQLPLVEGVRMNLWLSFPSGHTTSFFSLFFALAIVISQWSKDHVSKNDQTEQKWTLVTFVCLVLVPITLFALAALGGYSRIYLSQHFAQDVLGGITVGLLISVLCYALFKRFEQQKWYNYRLLEAFFKKNNKKVQ